MQGYNFTPAETRPTVPGRYMTRWVWVTITALEEAYFDGELFRNTEHFFEAYPQNRDWTLLEADA